MERKRKEEEAKRAAEEAAKQAAEKLATRKMTRATTKGGLGAGAQKQEKEEVDDLLRILLKKWSDQVNEARGASFENVWEKESYKEPAKVDEKAQGGNLLGVESGMLGAAQQKIDFTIDELFKRMRRIEKLTRLIKEDAKKQGLPFECPEEQPSLGGGGLTADALKNLQ